MRSIAGIAIAFQLSHAPLLCSSLAEANNAEGDGSNEEENTTDGYSDDSACLNSLGFALCKGACKRSRDVNLGFTKHAPFESNDLS